MTVIEDACTGACIGPNRRDTAPLTNGLSQTGPLTAFSVLTLTN